jgi:hypothetical protein
MLATIRYYRMGWRPGAGYGPIQDEKTNRVVKLLPDGRVQFETPEHVLVLHPANERTPDGWRLFACPGGDCEQNEHSLGIHRVWMLDEEYRRLAGDLYQEIKTQEKTTMEKPMEQPVEQPVEMTEYNWQEYDGRQRQPAASPRVTLRRNGIIALNRAALALIDTPARVVFLWDAGRRAIGVRPAEDERPGSYEVKLPKSGRGDTANISMRGFIKWAGIPTIEDPVDYVPKAQDGVLIVELESRNDPQG